LRRRKLSSVVVVLAIAATSVGLTACVDSDPDAADTPDAAPTIENEAIQTDEEGMTITEEEAPPPAEEEAPPPAEEGAEVEEADPAAVEAGQQAFNQACTTCHAMDGIGAGPIGPNLEGVGLTADQISSVIVNGQGSMPGGLVSGQQLDEVVAYLETIQ